MPGRCCQQWWSGSASDSVFPLLGPGPRSRSGLVEVRGGSLPCPTPLLGSRLPSLRSLLPSSRRGPRRVAPNAPWCAAASDTCPRSLRVFMGLEPAQRCLQRDPSPPPVIGPSSRLAALQVAYLGPGDSCCFQRGSGWARVTCRHTHHTHTRAGMVCLSQGPLLPCDLVPTGHLCLPGSPGRWQGSREGRGSRTGAWLGAQCPDRGLAFALREMGSLCPRALTAVQQRPFTGFGPDFRDRAGHGLPGGWCGPPLVPGCSGVYTGARRGWGLKQHQVVTRLSAAQCWQAGTRLRSSLEVFPKEREGQAFQPQRAQAKTPGPPACGQD